MTRWIVALVLAAALAGCKNYKKVESITYETGPCFGTCPVYTVTVHSNGTGLFVGHAHTTVTGNQPFTVTPAPRSRVRLHVGDYRPAVHRRQMERQQQPAAGVVRLRGLPLLRQPGDDQPTSAGA
jgi:hypothetical protein